MSFIQNGNGDLIRDSFPSKLGRLDIEPQKAEELADWQVVPAVYPALCKWACVLRNTGVRDPTRQFGLFYKPSVSGDGDPNSPTIYPVSLRLQGILGKHRLDPLGSFDGKEENACRARQFLTLHPGPFPDQFTAQVTALANIERLVWSALGRPFDKQCDGKEKDEPLWFNRRVFTKVRGIPEDEVLPSLLELADDPHMTAHPIANRWRITSKPQYFRRTPSGRLVKSNRHVLAEGDLVDVEVSLDLTTLRQLGKQSRTKVHLSFSTIVQLCTVSSLSMTYGITHTPLSAAPVVTPSMGVLQSAFDLAAEDVDE